MQVILLERIDRLGQMGEVVTVKEGFARNFLLPQRKALRATKENLVAFEGRRGQMEAHNLERRKEAVTVAEKLDGVTVILVRQASDSAQLYGSVTARDLAQAVTDFGVTIERRQVQLTAPIKTLGLHPVHVALHPEVTVTVTANVARSDADAALQAAGREDEAAGEGPEVAAFFEADALREAVEELADEPEEGDGAAAEAAADKTGDDTTDKA